jgi:chaperone BCS1
MTPADVAENLMPKSITEDFETCLKNLIQSLENAKKMAEEKAKEKVEYEDEEVQLKVEEDKQALT